MKKMLLFIIPFFLIACENINFNDSDLSYDKYNVEFIVSGECPFVSVCSSPINESCVNVYKLPSENHTIKYTANILSGTDAATYLRVIKNTNDESTVSIYLSVDGIFIDSVSTHDAYGEIFIKYSL